MTNLVSICYIIIAERPVSTESLRSTWGINVGGTGCFSNSAQGNVGMEYILYCDESIDTDTRYGDFFGGCIISSSDLEPVINALEKCKLENNLLKEIKWTKVTENYLQKYENVMRSFFSYVREGKVKIRIMFRSMDNQYISGSKEDKYFKLYYQFLKHAFGFTHTQNMQPFHVRIYLDQMPATRDQCERFKTFLCNMPQTSDLKDCALCITRDQIAEVKSHEHVLLQCVDIVLGAMQFRLNNHHMDKPNGKFRRGKRTIAKEKLYKTILREINAIHPNFNIGVSTGARGYENPHWESPYEHWLFEPLTSSKVDETAPV